MDRHDDMIDAVGTVLHQDLGFLVGQTYDRAVLARAQQAINDRLFRMAGLGMLPRSILAEALGLARPAVGSGAGGDRAAQWGLGPFEDPPTGDA